MNEPKRLRESGAPHLRALVEAGKRDIPAEHLEATVLGALGLGAAGGAAGLAGASGHGLARLSIAKLTRGLRDSLISKIGVGVIATTTAGSAGYVAGRAHEHALQREPTAGAMSATPTLPPRPSSDPSPVFVAAPTATSIPLVGDAPPAPSPAKRRTVSSTPAVDAPVNMQVAAQPRAEVAAPSIAVQLESIRRARSLVQEGDGKAALAELDAYETRNPHGTFEEEEMALRVRALRVAGDAAGAERVLMNLESRFPRSVHLAALAR
jgi:hypothetical protein